MQMADGLVIAVCLGAIVTDSRWRRIPNWLTFPAIGLGLAVNALDSGWSGLGRAVVGLLVALLLTVPLFALNFVKAGDVKLMAAFGTIKGVGAPPIQSFALWAFLYGALIGGFWAMAVLLRAKSLGVAWQRVWGMVAHLIGLPIPAKKQEKANALRLPMPYGIALSLGALMALALEELFGRPFPLLGA
jgi:prepilin peptidase CpaA